MKKIPNSLCVVLLLLLTSSCSLLPNGRPTESGAEEPSLSADASLASLTVDGHEILGIPDFYHVPFATESVEITAVVNDEKPLRTSLLSLSP